MNDKLQPADNIRQEAKERLKKITDEITFKLPEHDALKLVHELQVYQVELEMQNEELHRNRNLLETTQDKYKALYESSADAIMTLEPPGWFFTACNPATVKMFAAKNEAEFISKTPYYLSPEYQPDGSCSSEKAFEMINSAMKNGSHSFAWVHKRANGEEFHATVLLTKVKLHDIESLHVKEFLQATVRDITALENMVEERTKELNGKIKELERFRKATVEREFRMKELRDEIEKLKAEKGK